MTERGYSFTTTAELEILSDIKKHLCYVAENYEVEREHCIDALRLSKSYELPDGQVITVGPERFQAPEIMFQSSHSLPHKVYKALMECPEELRAEMANHVVFVGGNTLFDGLTDRLMKELKGIDASLPWKITLNWHGLSTPWKGGAVSILLFDNT